jgi:uncharacterized protein (TIGR04442 family)
MYEAIRSRLKQFYFDLSNPVHARLLQRDVEGELRKREEWEGAIPPEAFQSALERVRLESEYLNNVVPKLIEAGDASLRQAFVRETGLDLYRLEELEREYRLAHGLEVPREGLLFPEE